jgi:hypothetical protein
MELSVNCTLPLIECDVIGPVANNREALARTCFTPAGWSVQSLGRARFSAVP